MKPLLIIILLFSVLGIAGCAEKWEPKPLTVTELIAGKEKKVWKFYAIEVIDEGELDGPYSASDLYQTCDRDNEYIFYNNEEKLYEYTGGAIKCNNGDPDVLLEHSWSYTTANATFEFALPINLFGALYILPFTVKKLAADEMILEIYFDNLYQDGTDASYRVTLRSTDY